MNSKLNDALQMITIVTKMTAISLLISQLFFSLYFFFHSQLFFLIFISFLYLQAPKLGFGARFSFLKSIYSVANIKKRTILTCALSILI